MLTKVAAGGLAAAVAAVAGSYFGPLGTVGAAAAASVVTALTSEIFQRSIDRTAGALRPGQSRDRAGGTPAQPARRGSVLGVLALSVLVFALGMAAVTGIEKLTDKPLAGGAERSTTLGNLTNLDVGSSSVGDLVGGSKKESGESSDDSGKESSKDGLLGGLLG